MSLKKMLWMCISVILVAPAWAHAQPVLDTEETEQFIAVKLDDRMVRLEALVVKPKNATQPLPIALIAHGKDADRSDMNALRPRQYLGVARDLAHRGWLAVVIIRRGFGKSDGPYPALTSCETDRVQDQFLSDASELSASLAVIQTWPNVDRSRMIAIGASAGGTAVMALAKNPPQGLKGIINISGGLRSEACAEKSADSLVAAAKELSSSSQTPQLWVYADNDSYFPASVVNRMHERALSAGGNIRRVSIPKFEPDGHSLFLNVLGRRSWLQEMDQSLREWSLPTFDPAITREWMKKLDIKNRNFLETYLSSPGYKALAYDPVSKKIYTRFGSASESSASEFALNDCKEKEKQCKLALIGIRLAE